MSNFTDKTSDSDISNICETHTRRTKIHRHKVSIGKLNLAHYDSDTDTDDPPYVSLSSFNILLPSATSHWNNTHLDNLKIFYDNFSRPIDNMLDMVFNETGMFSPLTNSQRDIVKQVQDRMTFSCNLADVLRLAIISSDCRPSNPVEPNVYEEMIKHVKEEGLWNDSTSHERVQDFVTHLVMIMRWIVTDCKLSKAVFEDLFKIFVNMCGLISSDGSVWRSEKDILNKQCKVTSEADIAIITRHHVETFSNGRNMISLVSIAGLTWTNVPRAIVMTLSLASAKSLMWLVECRHQVLGCSYLVKNMTHFNNDSPETKHRQPTRKESGSDTSIYCKSTCYKEPSIYNHVGVDVLGQHAGELLIHTEKYVKNLNTKDYIYRPGVIVVGTKVTLTLLVCSVEHWLDIRTRNAVDKHSKAVIYYSNQKDLLTKNDRDELIESFARLKNCRL